MSWERQRDLKLRFTGDGRVDLDPGLGDLRTVEGSDNLVQALTLRILTRRGELGILGHRRYGSRIAELIGEPQDRENLGLLRRYVRKTLLSDPRVAEVVRLDVRPRAPGHVEVEAVVKPVRGEPLLLRVSFDGG